MDRRTFVEGTFVGVEMCKVQIQLHTFCFVSFMGIVFSYHHCVMALLLMNGCMLLMRRQECLHK